MSILESSSRAESLEKLVSGPGEQGYPEGATPEREDWALKALRLNPGPKTLEVLKMRLQRVEESAIVRGTSKFEPDPPTHPNYPLWVDTFYDKLLVAYHELGGKLNEIETARLTQFGYLGDPKERLQALRTIKF